MGKPWHPNEDDYKQIEKLAKRGHTKEEVATLLGISEGTWYNKVDEYPEIDAAYKRGKIEGIGLVSNKLFELCMGGNLGAICFYLKARAGWIDRQELNVNVNHFDRMPKEEFLRLAPKAIEALNQLKESNES